MLLKAIDRSLRRVLNMSYIRTDLILKIVTPIDVKDNIIFKDVNFLRK